MEEITSEENAAAEEIIESSEEKPPEQEISGEKPEEIATSEKDADELLDDLPKKKTAQERINEITKARRQAEREAEYWKNAALQSTKIEPVQTGMENDGRPKLETFESTEAYEDALLTWHDQRKEQRMQAVESQKKLKETIATFNENAQEVRKQYDDFDEVVERPVFTPYMRDALFASEHGPALAYYLASPEQEVVSKKIAAMSPVAQIKEIGRLETLYLLKKKEKKTTSAPEPINPIGTTTGGVKDSSQMTTAEWIAWDRQREMAKLKKKLGG